MKYLFRNLLRATVLLVSVLWTLPTIAQCPNVTHITITYSWAPNRQVAVTNNNVPSTPLNTALANWTGAANGPVDCYGPHFGGAGNGATVHFNWTNLGNSGGTTTRGRTHLDTATFTSGRLSGVDIDINSNMTAAAAVTEVVAHEIGHTQALNDCTRCGLHSTVMEVGDNVSSINDSVGRPGPTACDIGAVLAVATDYACPPPDPCDGDPCCGDVCCGDPCCGDPCCFDECCGDPCCGDECCGDPNCGQDCYQVCVQVCWDCCEVYDDYGECYWMGTCCDDPDCEIQCY
jgi:hypothetical protein